MASYYQYQMREHGKINVHCAPIERKEEVSQFERIKLLVFSYVETVKVNIFVNVLFVSVQKYQTMFNLLIFTFDDCWQKTINAQ